MWPVLLDLSIGPVPIRLHTYGLLVAIGMWAGVWLMSRAARRAGLPVALIYDLAVYLLLGGLLGGRLLYVILHPQDYLLHPYRVLFLWEGGMMFHGGIAGALVAGAFFLRRRKSLTFRQAADLAAPSVALGHALGRLGCFAAGCCYGRITTGPFAVTFTDPRALAPTGVPLIPTQLLASGTDLATMGLLIWLRRTPRPAGELFCWYLILASIIRLLLEVLRGDDRGPVWFGLTATQWVACAMLLVGLVARWRLQPVPG